MKGTGPVTSGHVEVDGARLEHLSIGPPPGEAPTMVFLHEGLGSAAQWRGLAGALVTETGFSAFAYSRQGYGASSSITPPRPLDYLEREAREILAGVLDAIGVKSCVLIGHSDGASIAALAAAGGDPRIRGAALIAPHFFVEDVTLDVVRRAVAAFETGDLRERLARRHADPDGALRGWSGAWLDPARRNWTIVPELSRIAIPVLFIQGADDPYGTDVQADAAPACGGPVEVHILPGVGHEPQREAVEKTAGLLARFVRSAMAGR